MAGGLLCGLPCLVGLVKGLTAGSAVIGVGGLHRLTGRLGLGLAFHLGLRPCLGSFPGSPLPLSILCLVCSPGPLLGPLLCRLLLISIGLGLGVCRPNLIQLRPQP